MPKKPKTKDLFKKAFIDEMKERLLSDKEELEKKLGKMEGGVGEEHTDESVFPEYGDEEDDNVHEIDGFLVNQNVLEDYKKRLRDVNAALERMKKGTYGICKYTNEKIEEGRLRARPTSSSSVAAKQMFKP